MDDNIDKDKIIEDLKHENKALKNRCYVLSDQTLCLFCRLDCEHRREKEDE